MYVIYHANIFMTKDKQFFSRIINCYQLSKYFAKFCNFVSEMNGKIIILVICIYKKMFKYCFIYILCFNLIIALYFVHHIMQNYS